MSTAAIIAGSGVGQLEPFCSWKTHSVETDYGTVELQRGEIDGSTVFFTPRHGRGHTVPPHRINYKALMSALGKLGVERIIGTAAVGSLLVDLSPGTAAVLTDFIDFSRQGVVTFFDSPDGVVHTDFSEPFCPEVSDSLLVTAQKSGFEVTTPCVYLRSDGPRYETPAEIAMFRSWGADVVGMTTVPEAILAREMGICYGAIAIITNYAAGISPMPLSHSEVMAMMASMGDHLSRALLESARSLPVNKGCRCERNR
ncbi:MAG: MTAP family purine nucleoside phosphorylase [Armatimonadota bacterium]